MPDQTAIPCTMMRGGTSRGPYFLARELPPDDSTRDRVLLAAMGSPDPRQIDGMGGATTLTSKVAIVSPSDHSWADVDYLFAQVSVDRALVDYGPTCGNMLAGVGPFAIERGLVPSDDPRTVVRIRNVNTDSLIEAVVETPDGRRRVRRRHRHRRGPGQGRADLAQFSWTSSAPRPGRCSPRDAARIDRGCRSELRGRGHAHGADHGREHGRPGRREQGRAGRRPGAVGEARSGSVVAGEKMGLGDVRGKVIPSSASSPGRAAAAR